MYEVVLHLVRVADLPQHYFIRVSLLLKNNQTIFNCQPAKSSSLESEMGLPIILVAYFIVRMCKQANFLLQNFAVLKKIL